MIQNTLTVVFGTKRLPADQLVAKGRNHVHMIMGNPRFPELQTLLPPLATACDVLDAADQHYRFNRGRVDRVKRNKAQALVVMLINRLGNGVRVYSHNDREAILSAGFTAKRKRQPSQPMPAPPRLRATPTEHTGTVRLNWGGVRNKRAYRIEFNLGDISDAVGWKDLLDTGRNHCIIPHLPPGAFCSFRVSAIGALGPGPVSDVATVKVPW
ncbi:MAG: fibronectin type III domain-containing protein [Flavobacteriales bacterium]|nr:fibronectin type III domain-containing protein [Flavobacteriales bacterium]